MSMTVHIYSLSLNVNGRMINHISQDYSILEHLLKRVNHSSLIDTEVDAKYLRKKIHTYVERHTCCAALICAVACAFMAAFDTLGMPPVAMLFCKDESRFQ